VSHHAWLENLYSYELENLGEMDKFLETYDLPTLNQEDINNLNRSVMCNKVEAILKILQGIKRPGMDR
jgi:hypothetical protein